MPAATSSPWRDRAMPAPATVRTPPSRRLAVVGWAAFGPWPAQAWRDLARVITWPLAFGAFTLVHGAITGWYPYDFLDVGERGYGSVAVQLVITSAEMALIAALIVGLNRCWSRTRASGTQIAGAGASPT